MNPLNQSVQINNKHNILKTCQNEVKKIVDFDSENIDNLINGEIKDEIKDEIKENIKNSKNLTESINSTDFEIAKNEIYLSISKKFDFYKTMELLKKRPLISCFESFTWFIDRMKIDIDALIDFNQLFLLLNAIGIDLPTPEAKNIFKSMDKDENSKLN